MTDRARHITLELIGRRSTRYTVNDGTLIGRDGACDVVVDHQSVSRRHAQVFLKGETWWVRDLQSTNKVFINGKQVVESPLSTGDSLSFGRKISFKVQLRSGAEQQPGQSEIPRRDPSVRSRGGDAGGSPYSWYRNTRVDRDEAESNVQVDVVSPTEDTLRDADFVRALIEARNRNPLDEHQGIQIYEGHGFAMRYPGDWQSQTVYTFRGPEVEGMAHTMTINCMPYQNMALEDFAGIQVRAKERDLQGFRLLLNKEIAMRDGTPAYKAVFCWWPSEDLRVYQHQVFVQHGDTGYVLTANFTRKTRKTIGPAIERMMLSFTPRS